MIVDLLGFSGGAAQVAAADLQRPQYHLIAVLVGAAILLAVVLVILGLISRAVRQLREGAERFAQGDLTRQVSVTGPLQLASLAESLNLMAQQLRERLQTVVQQRNELDSVLASMAESVLAVDPDAKLINLNAAAARLFNLDPSRALGRSIPEVVRNSALQAFVAETLAREQPLQRDIVLRRTAESKRGVETAERFLQAQGTALRSADGRRLGALVVLHDITRLRRLEVVRRDFVANASHEIKTPVTAIKASVETLLDSDEHRPEDIRHLLQIIRRQADRLHAIVEDLLTLARLEADRESQLIALSPAPLAPVLHAAAEASQMQASAKAIKLEVRCPPDLLAPINAMLLEQAVSNLIDNAIKYSPDGSTVRVDVTSGDEEAVVSVQDQGSGIEPEHLLRIFERFYRTDQARSRALGGTGLGLAIVKHVAQSHGGRVSVNSTLGAGSTFRIYLPLPPHSATTH